MNLRDMILAISFGTVSDSLARMSPGQLGYANWLNTGNLILRIYISSENSSPDLVIMCRYRINVYSRNWFVLKKKKQIFMIPQCIFLI